MIAGDWENMSQAVWRSPQLPLMQKLPGDEGRSRCSLGPAAWGSGARFKRDLLAYLAAYGSKKTGSLVKQLQGYDFGAVRAALIASIPSRQHAGRSSAASSEAGGPPRDDGPARDGATRWGWLALRDALRHVPLGVGSEGLPKPTPRIVVQVGLFNSQSTSWTWGVTGDGEVVC